MGPSRRDSPPLSLSVPSARGFTGRSVRWASASRSAALRQLTVRVYTRPERLVREVVAGQSMNAGANLVRWDGRDRNGGFATDGLYLVTVEALGRTERKSLAVSGS
jgi:flagellar hook assembly protein FlgD